MSAQDAENKRGMSYRYLPALVLLLAGATGTASAVDARMVTPRTLAPQSQVVDVLFKFEDFFGPNTRRTGQKTFRELDRDRNGSLSMEELHHAFGSRARSIFSRLDRDRDGVITPDEVQEANEPRRPRRAEDKAGQEQRPTPQARGADSKGNDSRGGGGNQSGGSSSSNSSGSGRSDDRGGNGNGNGPR